MRLLLTSIFIGLISYVYPQSIDHLDFGYRKGMMIKYEGSETNFKPDGTVSLLPIKFQYDIPHEEVVDNQLKVVFRITSYNDGDTNIINNTFLYLNNKGMFFWTADPGSQVFNKKKTNALQLPLTEKKSWKTYNNDIKATYRVLNLDTLINTPIGSYNVFSTQFRSVLEKTTTYEVVEYATEYYNQKIGKIAISYKYYFEFLGTKRKTLFSTRDYLIADYKAPLVNN